jgi:hypothetical protein
MELRAMSEAPITFLPLSAAPPRGALALLEGVLTADKLTAYAVFKDLADGWDPTVYVTASGDMFVNVGLWDLGRAILRGNREAQVEREEKVSAAREADNTDQKAHAAAGGA